MKYYHIWFQTKLKKYMLVDEIDRDIHALFKQIAKEKGIKLLASGSLPDHMHLLIELDDRQELSWAVQMLKGISSRRIFQEYSMLKQDLKTNNFWARKYGFKQISEPALPVTLKYVQNQKKDLHII